MVVGSLHPDDFVSLNREMRVRITYKWQNADFYRKLLTGSVSEEDWNALPFIQDTAGATKAFEATFFSPGTIPSSDDGSGNEVPYMLKVIANRMTWQIDRGGVELRAGDIIQVPYVGTALEPAAGQEYIEVIVHNDSTYTIPVADGAAPPVVTLAGTVAYSGTSVVLDAAATITDSDSVDFNGGEFSAVMGGLDFDPALDQLELDGTNAQFSGLNVQVDDTGFVTIGTISEAVGVGDSLVVTLGALATPALLQKLLQNIKYTTSDTTARSGDAVTVTVDMIDGDGGFATSDLITVNHS
jgi:hypothetical protein